MCQGFKAESIIDNRSWVIKSHFPYVYPFTIPCKISRSIVLVRNPFDVVASLFQFSFTTSQSRNCTNDFTVEFKAEWENFVKFAVKVWKDFYKFYLDQAKAKNIPVFFIRYEDLVMHKPKAITDSFRFILGQDSLEGLYIEKRINDILQKENAGFIYKPRSGKINMNSN